MRYPVILSFLLLSSLNAVAQQVPIYLYFASHNETTDQNFHGLDYSDPADYALMRTHVRKVCDTLLHYGVAYDMMLESNFILGCLKNELAATNSGDLIEWVSQQPGFSVQPHNHFKPFGVGANPYNYADLVYLLDSCGVDSAYVMGGFIWRNFTSPVAVNEDWTAWQSPQAGFSFPGFRWRPTLLWGGGSPNHIDDYNAYGIWKPKAATSAQFGVHDPTRTLINFGGGCGDDFVLWDTVNAAMLAYRILNFADSVQAHYANAPDAFFNMKVMMNFRHFTNPDFRDKLGEVLRIIQPYIENGRIKYAGILETFQAWQALHPASQDFFALKCEESVEISNTKPLFLTSAVSEPKGRIFASPNPVADLLYFSETMDGLEVYNLYGAVILLDRNRVNQLSVTDWPNGVYLIRSGKLLFKIMVQY
jgi:hypothetical protein